MDKFSPKRYPVSLTVIALITAYTLAYLYEKSILRLIRYVMKNENLWPPYWRVDIISSIVPLLVILLIFALAWIGLRYLPPSRFAATLFILSGLFIIGLSFHVFFPMVLPVDFVYPWWLRPPTILGQVRSTFMNIGRLGYRSSIYYLASGCILIGVAAFRRHRKENRDSFQES